MKKIPVHAWSMLSVFWAQWRLSDINLLKHFFRTRFSEMISNSFINLTWLHLVTLYPKATEHKATLNKIYKLVEFLFCHSLKQFSKRENLLTFYFWRTTNGICKTEPCYNIPFITFKFSEVKLNNFGLYSLFRWQILPN